MRKVVYADITDEARTTDGIARFSRLRRSRFLLIVLTG
jgi:hypothetical protein